MPDRRSNNRANKGEVLRLSLRLLQKFTACALLSCATALLLSGCAAPQADASVTAPAPEATANAALEATATEAPVAAASSLCLTDSENATLAFSAVPTRVVALQASQAQIWLLSGGGLIGVTEDAAERNLPIGDASPVGTTKHPSLEAIVALAPELVIYSPDIAGQAEAAEALRQMQIPVYACKVDTFSDYLYHLQQFTTLTGETALYEQNGSAVEREIQNIVSSVPKDVEQPRVLFLRAFSSGVKAKARDHIVCDMLRDFGAINIADVQASLLEDLSMETIVREDPDIILIVYMGEKDDKTTALLQQTLFSQPAWQSLSAVANDRVYELPTELFHYKPNARWAEAYQYLYDILYTES